MKGQEILLAITDIALTLIGLSSVVTALRRSKEEAWGIQEINGLIFLAIVSIATILFALLPFSLFYMEFSEAKIYTVSSTAYCIFSTLMIVGFAIRAKRSGFPSRRPRVFNTFAGLSAGVIFIMFLVAVGRIREGVFGYYLFGVIWLLVLAFVQFVVFLSFVGLLQAPTVVAGSVQKTDEPPAPLT
jgi:hypothetical protein